MLPSVGRERERERENRIVRQWFGLVWVRFGLSVPGLVGAWFGLSGAWCVCAWFGLSVAWFGHGPGMVWSGDWLGLGAGKLFIPV